MLARDIGDLANPRTVRNDAILATIEKGVLSLPTREHVRTLQMDRLRKSDHAPTVMPVDDKYPLRLAVEPRALEKGVDAGDEQGQRSSRFGLPNGNWIVTEWCPNCGDLHYFLLKWTEQEKDFVIRTLHEDQRWWANTQRRVIRVDTVDRACEIIWEELKAMSQQ